MAGCPYTWVKSLFASGASKKPGSEASSLRVAVIREQVTTVDVALPARSARWLIDLIPEDVVLKIRAEGIPLDAIQSDLAERDRLFAQDIFSLVEPERTVKVWLE